MHTFGLMSETTQPSSEPAGSKEHAGFHLLQDHPVARLIMFGRRHPVLTTLGLGGAGLIGGVEVAVGALFGASIATIIRKRNGAMKMESQEARIPEPAPMSEPAPAPVANEPVKAHPVRDRARAVLHAALGEHTNGTQPKQVR
jgi:hypothetical protein